MGDAGAATKGERANTMFCKILHSTFKAANDKYIDGLYSSTEKINAASDLHRDARFAALAGAIVAMAAVAVGAF